MEDKIKITLAKKSKNDLIDILVDLSQKFDLVNDYMQSHFIDSQDQSLLKKYKKAIRVCFDLEDLNLTKGENIIKDFTNVSVLPEHIIELMLYFVEQGVRFTNEYGDIDEDFYLSIETMFEKVCQVISANSMEDIYKTRCEKVCSNTKNTGWGFHDGLCGSYYENFEK
jgi:hypothetical protein